MPVQKWITLDNGTHVPILKGKSVAESMDAFVYKNRAKLHKINISYDHYSRLKAMFSDYHLGKAAYVVELQSAKLFSVDKTMYLVVGEYPYMYAVESLTFSTWKDDKEFWENIDGK